MKYLKLMRVKHYLKNLLVIFPLVFSGRLFHQGLLLTGILGFLAFSLLSSVIYIINDIRDVESDRNHPTKCNRPIASGAVSVRQGWMLAAGLLVATGVLHGMSGGNWLAAAFLALYFLLNLLYSFGLKDVPIVDVTILVSGFLLRLLYGSMIFQIEISRWLYLTVVTAAFYLGLGKRRNELAASGEDIVRPVLRRYTEGFLDKSMYMCATQAIVFYSLWTVDPVTVERTGGNALVWTVPLVILIFLKYSLNIERSFDGDPVEVLMGDKLLMGLMLAFGAAVFCIIYL